MANVDIKSGSITNFDASPRVAESAGEGCLGNLAFIDDFVPVIDTDDSTSIYRVIRVPSNCLIKAVRVRHTALGGSCAMDIGLYYANSTGEVGAGKTPGAVIDVDFFASAYVASSAQLAGIDITHEAAAAFPLTDHGLPLWEAAGLTSDPGGKFDIAATLTVACDTTGTLVIEAFVITP